MQSSRALQSVWIGVAVLSVLTLAYHEWLTVPRVGWDWAAVPGPVAVVAIAATGVVGSRRGYKGALPIATMIVAIVAVGINVVKLVRR
jgi:threonine/homoserine efflux transporter RhtA